MLQSHRASLVAQLVNNPPAVQETWLRSLGWEDPLEEGGATHSSILAWRIHLGLIPGLGWSPGVGKGYPLYFSDLENSINHTVLGVTKSWTQLSYFHFQSHKRSCPCLLNTLCSQLCSTLISPCILENCQSSPQEGLSIQLWVGPGLWTHKWGSCTFQPWYHWSLLRAGAHDFLYQLIISGTPIPEGVFLGGRQRHHSKKSFSFCLKHQLAPRAFGQPPTISHPPFSTHLAHTHHTL